MWTGTDTASPLRFVPVPSGLRGRLARPACLAELATSTLGTPMERRPGSGGSTRDDIVRELGKFIDGKRSISDIRDARGKSRGFGSVRAATKTDRHT